MKIMIRIVCSLLMVMLFSAWAQAQDGTSDFVEARVDRTSAYYVGEPILYTWRWFLATTNIEIAKNDSDVKLPSFSGFGQETLSVSTESSIRNGQTYQVITQQIVLYARFEGAYTIDPVRIVIPETPFSPGQTLESAPVQVMIQSLPDNAPGTFKNAVGQFDLKASFDHLEGKTGDPLNLSLTITGSGNGLLMYAPGLRLGEEWRQYPGQSTRRQDGPLLGEQVFTWQLIPLQPGTLTIPSQSWSFLNPQTGQYETRTTEPFSVTITGDPITNREAMSMMSAAEPTLYPIRYGQGWIPETRWVYIYGPHNPYPSSGITWDGVCLGMIAPAIAGIVWGVSAVWGRRRTQGQKQAQKRKRGSVFQDRLTALTPKSPQEIAVGVAAILRDLLCQQGSSEDIEVLIQRLPSDLQTAFRTCFDVAEAAPYAPFSPEDASHLLQDAQRLLRAVEAS